MITGASKWEFQKVFFGHLSLLLMLLVFLQVPIISALILPQAENQNESIAISLCSTLQNVSQQEMVDCVLLLLAKQSVILEKQTIIQNVTLERNYSVTNYVVNNITQKEVLNRSELMTLSEFEQNLKLHEIQLEIARLNASKDDLKKDIAQRVDLTPIISSLDEKIKALVHLKMLESLPVLVQQVSASLPNTSIQAEPTKVQESVVRYDWFKIGLILAVVGFCVYSFRGKILPSQQTIIPRQQTFEELSQGFSKEEVSGKIPEAKKPTWQK